MGIGAEVNAVNNIEDPSRLWSSILKEVASARIGKLPHNKGLIVLGDYCSGKSTLACRLSHKNVPPKSPVLEYHFVEIRDEATDDQTKLNVWVLDGDLAFMPYLKFPLNKNTFSDRMVVITVDMERPWNIMEKLENWAEALEDYIKTLDIDIEDMKECKDTIVQQFREYIEPESLHLHAVNNTTRNAGGISDANAGEPPTSGAQTSRPAVASVTGGSPLHPATAALLALSGPNHQQQGYVVSVPHQDEDGCDAPELVGGKGEATKIKTKRIASDVLKELPITPGALTNNLGIPLVVVVTKTDVMDDLEKKQEMSEEQYDLVQMHIRRFCLSYGAALVYVSAKNGKNCGLLSNYLQHRIYGFPFTQNAYVIDKDSVFIPSGWDSLNKLGLLEQNLTRYHPGDDFSTVVPKPPEQRNTANEEPEIAAMDDQLFLSRLYTVLQRDTSANGGGENSNESHNQSSILDVSGTPASRPSSSGSASRSRSSGAGLTGAAAGSSSEKVLAIFFNNLLSKGPSTRQTSATLSSPLAGPTSETSGLGEHPAMSATEMQSELERLARTSKEALDISKGPAE